MTANRRRFLRSSTAGLLAGLAPPPVQAAPTPKEVPPPGRLSPEHLAAVRRRRRVVVNFDTGFGAPYLLHGLAGMDIDRLVKGYFSMLDEPGVQIDSVWWCWLDGNYANYPSKVLPVWDHPGLKKWWQAGIDPVRVFAAEARKRGLETFFSYRLNGTDMTDVKPLTRPLLKTLHPEWLIRTWESYGNPGYWNFAVPEVRDYKLRILREVAENYDHDGLEIDFARVPVCLTPGRQWEERDHLTAFLRAVRAMTLEVERKRGRPYLLAARVPENLEGCHCDGLDVEAWAREGLVDLFVLGNRSYEVDLPAFRRVTAGTPIKLYPCLDDHHATDGYEKPPIEVLRGVFATWWHQGADGIQTFNFSNFTPAGAALLGWKEDDYAPPSVTQARPSWDLHRQAYREMAGPHTLEGKDKTFVAQRRGGGHGPSVVPDPADWAAPRWMYYLTNLFAPLPAPLANDGKADTLLFLYVADDVAAAAGRVRRVAVRLLLSDPEAKDLPAAERLEAVTMASHDQPGRKRGNVPPRKGIEKHVEVRLNNALLGTPSVRDGWLVFPVRPRQLAVGKNLIGVRLDQRRASGPGPVVIEMLEIEVTYKRP
jgi:hypothetical protein